MHENPVLIIGGGPAGAATALVLARRGLPVCVLEAREHIAAKIGETLAPNFWPYLAKLGLQSLVDEKRHMQCYGNRFIWGSPALQEKLFITTPGARGYHLDRKRFETDLCTISRAHGAEWRFGCKVLKVEAAVAGSRLLHISNQGKTESIRARFVVDASGRNAKFARAIGLRRVVYDRLIGLACAFDIGGHISPQYTTIEAVSGGWYYAAPLPRNRLMTVFMTDADLFDTQLLHTAAYREALRRTTLIGELVPPDARPGQSILRPRPAAGSHLPRVYGQDWLAVGDAAFAYDPLSSYGIASALGGAYYAGHAIADHLAGRPEAMPAYTALHARAYSIYLAMLKEQYQLERRWPDAPFWQRRHAADFARESPETPDT